jgi:hypothetical protein
MEKDIVNIRQLGDSKLYKHREIAEMFNTTRGNVSKIIQRSVWVHVIDDPLPDPEPPEPEDGEIIEEEDT